MASSGDPFAEKRATNSRALAAFGVSPVETPALALTRTIHEGDGAIVYTIGYERRSPSNLTATLSALGVDLLLDVREKPTSRRAVPPASSEMPYCVVP